MTELPPLPEPDAWTTRIDIDWAKKNAGRAGSFYAKKSDPNDIGMYTAETVQRLMAEHAAEAVRVALGEPVAWLARNRAGHLFIINGNGPHDVFGGFPVYQV